MVVTGDKGMKNLIQEKDLPAFMKRLRRHKNRVVFTNGVFDILHRGHVDYLTKARTFGDVLIVGLNSDASTRRLKGANRPIFSQKDRAAVLLALKAVDYVVIFKEDTPDKIIQKVKPDILVKGADYKLADIAGGEFVSKRGGKVRRVRLTRGCSTSKTIKKIQNSR